MQEKCEISNLHKYIVLQYTVETGYNDIGFSYTSHITSDIMIYQLVPNSIILLTVSYSTVITILVYNDTIYVTPCKTLK